jgi:type VI secretion system ImpJ/VasE family protein
MPVPELVHWHEGLFLQPHHLQVMQRSLLEQFTGERRLGWVFPYGVVEWELSDDALQNCRIQFNRLRVIMRSGREVRVPGNAELPPLDIKQAFEMGSGSMLISLAIPHWHERRPNQVDATGQAKRSDCLYSIIESQVFDENTGASPQPILLRRINARLVLDDEGRAEYETLPLLRVKRAAGEAVGRPNQDPDFIPPCLVLDGSPDLRRLIMAIADQVEASRRELVPQLMRDGFNPELLRGAQFAQLLKLRTLNRFAACLPPVARASGVSPFQAYLELRELLGELVALQPERDELFEMPPYRHEEPAMTFYDLAERIRQLLVTVVKQTILRVDFVDIGGLPTAALTDEHLTRPNEYFLGVATTGDPAALSRLVEHPDNFKLMAKSQILRPIRGVRLVEERHPPPDLPRQNGLFYYRLDRGADRERAWNDIKADRDKSIAIKRPKDEFPDARFTLYMTIPQV